MTDIAIIDIGSNSVRLVCYEADQREFKIIYNDKTTCGLGKSLDKNGKLSGKGRKLASKALQRYTGYAKKMNMEQILPIATAAIRESEDGEDFMEHIQKKTGLEIRVLSGSDEAMLSAYGVISAFPNVTGIVGDLGGGSLELANITADMPYDTISLPIGVLRLQHKGINAEQYLQKILAGTEQKYSQHNTFYAVGGSWRALAKAFQRWDGVIDAHSHGFETQTENIKHFLDVLPLKSNKTLIASLGVDPARAKQLPYAAIILKNLIDKFNLKTIKFCNAGLRDGLLYTLTRETQLIMQDQDKRILS